MIGPQNERVREGLFWISAIALAASIVVLDRAVLFVYFPRWIFVLPVLLLLFPSRVNSTYWARVVACVALALLPYVLAPVLWNVLKSFYIDCEALRPGIAFSDALAQMSSYDGRPQEWMARATMLGVEESGVERDQRVVILPSPEHSADWCILYPDQGRLGRVEIHPD